MANGLVIFFLLGLLLLSKAEPRPVPESDSSVSTSSTPIRLQSPEEPQPSLDDEDACKCLDSEECLMRRSMVAHTDYIYTQDINSTGP